MHPQQDPTYGKGPEPLMERKWHFKNLLLSQPISFMSLSCTSFCHVPLLEFQVHFLNIHFSAMTQVHLNDSTSLDVKLFCSYRKKILLSRKLFTFSFSKLPCKRIQQKEPYLLFSPRPESTI